MNGLELSRAYFHGTAEPELKRAFPELYPRLAAGLCGNGSECFGFDDLISRDHDWGADFFIWTREDDSGTIPALSEWKDKLFQKYPPQFPRRRSEYGGHIGVETCGGFFSSLIGTPGVPRTLSEWLRAPEENLAMAVNGAVFYDGAGDFTRIRERLMEYFPEDIRRKRAAARCMSLAQTGQYNHERTAKRGDWVTLQTIVSRFTVSALSMAFILNRTYMPYYKWAYRAASRLPVLGAETASLLLSIAEAHGFDEAAASSRQRRMSELCALFAGELRAQGLSDSDDWFLAAHGESVMKGINDGFLRSLPAQYEI